MKLCKARCRCDLRELGGGQLLHCEQSDEYNDHRYYDGQNGAMDEVPEHGLAVFVRSLGVKVQVLDHRIGRHCSEINMIQLLHLTQTFQ